MGIIRIISLLIFCIWKNDKRQTQAEKGGRLVQRHYRGLPRDCYVMHFLKDFINEQNTLQF